MQILEAHFANCENALLENSKIPSVSGHSLHKGTPREAFIREFLRGHLPSNYGIGTGEIIDCNSKVGESRNQNDIVLHELDFPKIDLGGKINAFLRESVIATIEVKSTLTKEELLTAARTARNLKMLHATGTLPLVPIATYIVAFRGPAKMKTVFNWIAKAYKPDKQDSGWVDPDWPSDRRFMRSPAIDGVFVLGKGACIFENNVGFWRDSTSEKATWSVLDKKRGSLFLLFLSLLGLVQGTDFRNFHPFYYATNFKAENLSFHKIDKGQIETFPRRTQP